MSNLNDWKTNLAGVTIAVTNVLTHKGNAQSVVISIAIFLFGLFSTFSSKK